jgi:L-arabinose isomerase
MGHLYPGMLDVSTDMTMVSTHFGGHMEVLEFDDLRVRFEKVTEKEIDSVLDEARSIFEIDKKVDFVYFKIYRNGTRTPITQTEVILNVRKME